MKNKPKSGKKTNNKKKFLNWREIDEITRAGRSRYLAVVT